MLTAKIPAIGRVFFGTAIAGLGILTVADRDFPYMLIPAEHQWIPGLFYIAIVCGVLLTAAGGCIALAKKTGWCSIWLGILLAMIFCFYHIPYQLFASPNHSHLWDWENAAKELSLASGAWVITGHFTKKSELNLAKHSSKLLSWGVILFSLTILSYGVNHFVYADAVADYVPSWIPFRLFWAYFAGAALLAASLAIIIKVKSALAARLLGIMILAWFIVLHIPRVMAAPAPEISGEMASAFLALAYGGIALVISGRNTPE